MPDHAAGNSHSGAVFVGRESLEASRASLLHISNLLQTAEDCFAIYNADLAGRTALARSVVDKAQWVVAKTILELQLDRLVESESWEHPIQVLERPRPSLEDLIRVCDERIERSAAEGARARLVVVREKIERALRIADSARRRRNRRKKGDS